MTEPVAYLDGEFLPNSEAKVSIFDLGLVQGASVTEMVRTFAHRPFRLEEHLDRLFCSLRAVGFPLQTSREQLRSRAGEVLDHNAPLIPKQHDLGLVIFITAGLNPTYVGAAGLDRPPQPTLGIHTFPLPFELWAGKFETGQHLVTPSIRHIPPASLDPKIKYRSRLHWHLADKQAKLVDPQAGALLLDQNGAITETSSGNFFVVSNGRIRTPPADVALGGVSRKMVEELAAQLGLACEEAALRPYDALNAEEAFTSSTPYCLLPVTQLNGSQIGGGTPGPIFQQLMDAWSQQVGLDIVAQMRRGAEERKAEPAEG